MNIFTSFSLSRSTPDFFAPIIIDFANPHLLESDAFFTICESISLTVFASLDAFLKSFFSPKKLKNAKRTGAIDFEKRLICCDLPWKDIQAAFNKSAFIPFLWS